MQYAFFPGNTNRAIFDDGPEISRTNKQKSVSFERYLFGTGSEVGNYFPDFFFNPDETFGDDEVVVIAFGLGCFEALSWAMDASNRAKIKAMIFFSPPFCLKKDQSYENLSLEESTFAGGEKSDFPIESSRTALGKLSGTLPLVGPELFEGPAPWKMDVPILCLFSSDDTLVQEVPEDDQFFDWVEKCYVAQLTIGNLGHWIPYSSTMVFVTIVKNFIKNPDSFFGTDDIEEGEPDEEVDLDD